MGTVTGTRSAFAEPITISPLDAGAQRITALDGLRGIAILAVLEFHFAEGLTGLNGAESAIYNFIRTGWLGVDLFFVLSGFLITGILADSKTAPHYLRTFYWRRAVRIFPPYYAFLFVAGVLYPLLRHRPLDSWWHWAYLTNVALASHLPLNGPTHFWSLAIEEQFYLFWPLLIWALPRRAAMRMCVVCICGALLVRTALTFFAADSMPAMYVLMPCRVDALAVGSWLALARWSGISFSVRQLRGVAIGCASMIIAVLVFRGSLEISDPLMTSVGYTVSAIAFGALMMLTTAEGRVQRVCEWRLLRQFGKVSYSVYIFHVPLHGALWLALGFAPLLQWVHSPLLRLAPFLIAGPLGCLGLGLLSWHLFEKHFIALKNRY